MKPCGVADWEHFYDFAEHDAANIEAHKLANQFFCPVLDSVEGFKLYNSFDSLNNQVLNVYFSSCLRAENSNCVNNKVAKQKYLDGKQVMILMNN